MEKTVRVESIRRGRLQPFDMHGALDVFSSSHEAWARRRQVRAHAQKVSHDSASPNSLQTLHPSHNNAMSSSSKTALIAKPRRSSTAATSASSSSLRMVLRVISASETPTEHHVHTSSHGRNGAPLASLWRRLGLPFHK
jgi:hypothetical protein